MTKGQEVIVERLPKCDFCESDANYDAKTRPGPWANLCEMCWKQYAASTLLGIGIGQRLVLGRDI